jgi:hypothetical protein
MHHGQLVGIVFGKLEARNVDLWLFHSPWFFPLLRLGRARTVWSLETALLGLHLGRACFYAGGAPAWAANFWKVAGIDSGSAPHPSRLLTLTSAEPIPQSLAAALRSSILLRSSFSSLAFPRLSIPPASQMACQARP